MSALPTESGHWVEHIGMSALCRKRTYAAQQSIAVYWDMHCEFSPAGGEGRKVLADSRHIPPVTIMASALSILLGEKRFKKYLSIWLFLIAQNWSLCLAATYRC